MSSYRGSFHDLCPSDQADIASFTPATCRYCHGSGWTPASYGRGPEPCGCDDAGFFEILAEQEVYSDE